MTITGEAHDSPITGGVDGARDRRRLAWNCNGGWCVCPPRPCFPPLRNLAAAFLSAADHTAATRQTATRQRTPSGIIAITATVVLGTVVATPTKMGTAAALSIMLPAVDVMVIQLTQAVALAPPPATPAVPAALLAHTAPRSTSLVARACLGRAAKQPTPAHRAAAPPPQAFAPPRAITHQPTVARARRDGVARL